MKSHFSRLELIKSATAERLKIDNTPPQALLNQLDLTIGGANRVRAFLGKPMVISSGYRCYALNKAVGGKSNSQHLRAEAIDFTAPEYGDPRAIFAALLPMLEVIGIDQLIHEGTWVHMSFTPMPRCEALEFVDGIYVPVLVNEAGKIS